MLRKDNVAHIYNSWTDMPSVAKQIAMPESRTTDDLIDARFLLRPGRRYEDAIKAFTAYSEIRESDDAARSAGKTLIVQSLETKPKRGS
jgi:hypothetical protein